MALELLTTPPSSATMKWRARLRRPMIRTIWSHEWWRALVRRSRVDHRPRRAILVHHVVIMPSKITSHRSMVTHQIVATLIVLALCGYRRVVHDGLDSL